MGQEFILVLGCLFQGSGSWGGGGGAPWIPSVGVAC